MYIQILLVLIPYAKYIHSLMLHLYETKESECYK